MKVEDTLSALSCPDAEVEDRVHSNSERRVCTPLLQLVVVLYLVADAFAVALGMEDVVGRPATVSDYAPNVAREDWR
jgi:hypothetical protein